MEVKMNKDIREYKSKNSLNLTLVQTFVGVIGVIASGFTIFALRRAIGPGTPRSGIRRNGSNAAVCIDRRLRTENPGLIHTHLCSAVVSVFVPGKTRTEVCRKQFHPKRSRNDATGRK